MERARSLSLYFKVGMGENEAGVGTHGNALDEASGTADTNNTVVVSTAPTDTNISGAAAASAVLTITE